MPNKIFKSTYCHNAAVDLHRFLQRRYVNVTEKNKILANTKITI